MHALVPLYLNPIVNLAGACLISFGVRGKLNTLLGFKQFCSIRAAQPGSEEVAERHTRRREV